MPSKFSLNPDEQVYAHRTESLLGGWFTHSALCLSRSRVIEGNPADHGWIKCYNHGLNTPEGQFPNNSAGSGIPPTSKLLGPVSQRQLDAIEIAHQNRGLYNPALNNCWRHVSSLESARQNAS